MPMKSYERGKQARLVTLKDLPKPTKLKVVKNVIFSRLLLLIYQGTHSVILIWSSKNAFFVVFYWLMEHSNSFNKSFFCNNFNTFISSHSIIIIKVSSHNFRAMRKISSRQKMLFGMAAMPFLYNGFVLPVQFTWGFASANSEIC